MMMPSILGENLFDDFMNDFRLPAFPDVDKELYGKHAKNLMKTDVKETEKGYEVDMDLPGFKKDEIQMELNDGVLTISAAKGLNKELYGKHAKNLMKTDVKETEKGYEVDMDLPGFKKDEIQMELNDGVLTISAAKGLNKDEEDKKGNYIRKERYAGSMSRSFYVGKHVTVEDVHPKYENGILSFSVPKEEAKPVEEKKNYISIEG